METPKHVITIDDDEIHCYAMVKILEASGFRVSHAHNGRHALEMIEQEMPDAILLDINLPDVNGYEVCARLKSNSATADIPVIFHTATTATALARSHAEMVGSAAFLTYPIDREHLITVVMGAIGKAAAKRREQGLRTLSVDESSGGGPAR